MVKVKVWRTPGDCHGLTMTRKKWEGGAGGGGGEERPWVLEEWKGGGDIEDFGAWEVIPIFTSERRSIVTKTF